MIITQNVFFDVKANGSGNGVGDHQRRRGQERLFGIGVNTSVENYDYPTAPPSRTDHDL